ncbi:subtilisin-like protease SBT5.3 [Trifolium pratense]|uniref:subtilisin-like protease SBT5.3 n=1 Tax=Trifolium pratense TaxID=57577 RepID=UPI001E6913BA|nr:subtilisin-like protease SBT5.3 [Trifolium pratense]
MHQLHTTRSWEFLGLEGNRILPKYSIWEKARYGDDTIIGNLDTGVWPESQSFSDQGMSPIPSKWRGNGICQIDNFIDSNKTYCNRKLIGARFFYKGYEAYAGKLGALFYTARDTIGHGSHTLSTAGGNFVQGVSVLGNGNGTAKGGSPKARVAAYKVCWLLGCNDADILAGFEAAISDGVDVLSVSLGGKTKNLFTDSVAIGSFHAVANSIVVVSSAGNDGPYFGTVVNTAPWLFTVAASTIDRDFTSYVKLGDNTYIKGTSLSSKDLPSREFYPLISAKEAKHFYVISREAKFCRHGTLDVEKVMGKIVVCLEDELFGIANAGEEASSAGAVGMILASDYKSFYDFTAYPHVLPTSHVNYSDGQYIYSYIQSENNPVAYITKAITEFPIIPAPVIASFSSRGPSTILPSILKPDITAPGVNIIAAYSEATSVFGIESNNRIPYNSFSGTSMSCPHVSGIVGLLKTLHPEWSPAAIKSAIMTTASKTDNSKRPIKDRFYENATPFAYGSGHIQPDLAIDPGLIYDLNVVDYLNLLCGYNQSHKQIKAIYNKPFICPKSYNVLDFNYPTITILDLEDKTVNVSRTVTNVGRPSTYIMQSKAPDGVSVVVEPSYLSFKKVGEKKSFKVIVMKTMDNGDDVSTTLDYVFGELLWTNGNHRVRSTIAVKFK